MKRFSKPNVFCKQAVPKKAEFWFYMNVAVKCICLRLKAYSFDPENFCRTLFNQLENELEHFYKSFKVSVV